MLRGDDFSYLRFFHQSEIETITWLAYNTNKHMRCSNRPFWNPYRSLQDFWGWALTNIEALTLEEREDDREYTNFVWRLFEDIHEPYKALVTITQHFHTEPGGV